MILQRNINHMLNHSLSPSPRLSFPHSNFLCPGCLSINLPSLLPLPTRSAQKTGWRSDTRELKNKAHKYKACHQRIGSRKFRYTPKKIFQLPRLDKGSQCWGRGKRKHWAVRKLQASMGTILAKLQQALGSGAQFSFLLASVENHHSTAGRLHTSIIWVGVRLAATHSTRFSPSKGELPFSLVQEAPEPCTPSVKKWVGSSKNGGNIKGKPSTFVNLLSTNSSLSSVWKEWGHVIQPPYITWSPWRFGRTWALALSNEARTLSTESSQFVRKRFAYLGEKQFHLVIVGGTWIWTCNWDVSLGKNSCGAGKNGRWIESTDCP